MDSEAIIKAIKANLKSNTQRVSGKLDISQSIMFCHLHNLDKSIQSY